MRRRGVNFRKAIDLEIPYGNLFAYLKYDNNVLDSANSYDGTAFNISYESGQSGQRGLFNGTSSYVSIADADKFSFTDGENDLPFSITGLFTFNKTGDQWLVSKRSNTSTSSEWSFDYFQGYVRLLVCNQLTDFLRIGFLFSPVLGQEYHIGATYNANYNRSGLNLFLNGIKQTYALADNGTYEKMTNTNSPVIIGKAGYTNGAYHGGTQEGLGFWDIDLNEEQMFKVYEKQINGQELI